MSVSRTPAHVPSARAPSPRPQSSRKQSEPSFPSNLPYIDFEVTDARRGDVYHIAEGGIVETQYGADIVNNGSSQSILQHADLTVVDNSQNTRYHNDGEFRQHYGPIVQYEDSDDDYSDRTSESSSSYISSDREIEHRYVQGRRESPVTRNASGRRISQRSSAAGSIVDSRFGTPPEDIRRPGNPTAMTASADSLSQLVNTVLSQVNGNSSISTPPRGRTPEPVHPNGISTIPMPKLSPTRPLSTVKRSTSPRPISPPQDEEPVIPPRLPRSSTGQHTTTTSSDSSSLRRVSEAQLTSAPSSDRFSPFPLGDAEEIKVEPSRVQEPFPTKQEQSQMGVEMSTPNKADKEKKKTKKHRRSENGEKEKKAGCLSCCVIS